MAGKWRGTGTKIDYGVLSDEVIRHYLASQRDVLQTIIANFIEDYPLIYQLPWDPVCQRQLDEYLNKIASKKFTSLPSFLTVNDIVQEAMTKIFNKLDTFHYMSRFRTWCTTILIRAGLTLIEKEKRREAMERFSMDGPIRHGESEQNRHDTTPNNLPDPEAEYFRKELLRHIDQALEGSKNKNRDKYIILQKMEGASAEIIAGELSISISTVNMFMNRFRKRLKEIIFSEAKKTSRSNERSSATKASKRTGVGHEL